MTNSWDVAQEERNREQIIELLINSARNLAESAKHFEGMSHLLDNYPLQFSRKVQKDIEAVEHYIGQLSP